MIDAIIRWSLHNRLFVLLAGAALIVWGFMRAREMPVDIFPDLTAPTVTIMTEAHGMAPEEAERLITFPIESALHGASGVRRVRSSTSVGSSVIWVEFDWGTDIYRARQIISEKLQLVAPTLPPEVDPPILAPISSIMGEILFVGLRSETTSPEELRTLADWDIRRRLLSVPGISQVVPIGGGVQQFQVLALPERMAAHGVTLQQVVEAVRASNENTSAGFYEQGGQEHLIHGIGRIEEMDDIAQSVITPGRDGVPVRILDVAHVVMGTSIKRGDAAINATSGVVLGIQKQPDINTLEVTAKLDEVLDDIEAGLPHGVSLERRLLRQADFIETGVSHVEEALRDGSLLVVLIIGIFLLSAKATLITALAIPLSLVVSVLVLDMLGASLNTMTLGGMAIAVGALVDDAIIDVENVVRRLREHTETTDDETKDPSTTLEIVFLASKEIRGSIVFATLIIVLVFLPIFFLDGVEGRLLEPLGMAYVVSLGASLLVALTITPALCSLLLPGSRAIHKKEEPFLIRGLRARYEPILDAVLDRWRGLLLVSLAGVLVAGIATYFAGRTFLPEFNEGALTISVVTLAGTSIEQSNQIGDQVERLLLSHPEVVATSRRTGRAELDEHAQGVHASEIDVRLAMQARSEEAMLSAMRAEFSAIPGVNIIIGQPISHRIDHMLSGTRANIAVKIFGPDLDRLRIKATQVRAQMEGVPGVVDLAIEESSSTLPVTTVRFDRRKLAQYGLRIEDVAESIETAFYGQSVSQILTRQYAFDLVVRYPETARKDLETIRGTMLATPTGAWVPLEELAQIHREQGPNQISRENGQRKVVVMCNVGDGQDLHSVVTEIQRRVTANVPNTQGDYITYGGQFEAAEEATNTLTLLGVAVIAGIFLLLYMALASGRDALLVMLNLPLALIGGVAGVYLFDGVLSIASIIGFITLFGIATRNGIMMITHMRHLLECGEVQQARDAVIQGASERLAPILMTAMASGLGLLPLAMAVGEPGSEIQAPMAIVILCGLATSTILNMFVVPSMMLRFGSVATTHPIS